MMKKATCSVKGLLLDTVDLVSKYDPVLKQHLENGPGNAKYLSNKIQNGMTFAYTMLFFKRFCLL
jgi:hypothetical protein